MLSPFEAKTQVAPPFPGCDVQTQIPEQECDALQIFFEKAEGFNWADRGGWMRAGQACEWKGIVCETGPWPRNVRKIILIDNDLGGSIPGELSFLTELEELVIQTTATAGYFNKVEGFLPSALEDLKNLKVLRISGHEIRGPIPNEWVNLESLEVLDLSNNLLDGRLPEGIGDINSLKEIDLSTNSFIGSIPANFGNLSNLEKLDLASNRFSGSIPQELGQLSKLSLLDLRENEFSGSIPASISNLRDLITLNLSNNQLSGPPPPSVIKLATELPICSLEQSNPQFCIPDVPIYRSGNESDVCGVPLQSSCSFCSSTQASGNSACGALESIFYKTGGIDWSNQAGWLAQPDPCTWFGIGCSDDAISTLALPGNNLSGDIPEEIGQLSNLSNLDLSGNILTGPIPLSVALLQNTTDSCNLSANDGSLCIPDNPDFTNINPESICGLPIALSCSAVGSPGFFVSLETIKTGTSSTLSWRATRRVEDAHFEVERKENGIFSIIGIVDTPDLANTPDVFSFSLPELENGIHTFRIHLTSPAGSSLYSDEIDIAVSADRFLLETPYPNPAQSTTSLRFSVEDSQPVTLALYNIMGQRVQRIYYGTPDADVLETVEIPLQGLAGGVYFLRLEGSTFSTSRTLVIQN